MSGETRLDRLLPALSAQERAILMLRDFKAEKPQDRQLLHTAPDAQAPALNRLIGMMNAANGDLAHVLVIISERVKQEELRFSWLAWARICAMEMWAVRAHFNVSAREAITESDHKEREKEARAELLPVEECATTFTEDHHTWDDTDCEIDDDGERSATDEAWYRVRDEKIRELNALVADGTLVGKGKGKRLKIACGSFYDWLGEPALVVPDLGIAYDVRPDAESRDVTRTRADHEFIRQVLNRGACELKLPLDMESPMKIERAGRFDEDTARVVVAAIRSGVCENWREFRAISEQVEAITAEFDGEDVLRERTRQRFDETKASLIQLHGALQEYTGPFELPEPDDEVRAAIQRIVDNEVRHVQTRVAG